jgi:hypothetical protein
MLHIEAYLQMFFSQPLEYERGNTMVIAICYSYYNILLFKIQEHIFEVFHLYTTFGLFRTSRAREAILENTLLRKRPGERIQPQTLLYMVEFSTESAEEPTFGMVSDFLYSWH